MLGFNNRTFEINIFQLRIIEQTLPILWFHLKPIQHLNERVYISGVLQPLNESYENFAVTKKCRYLGIIEDTEIF